jgi:hypothetical protein
VRSVDNLGDALTLDNGPTTANTDGVAREQKILSRNGNATKNKTSGGYEKKHTRNMLIADSCYIGVSWLDTRDLRIIYLTTGIIPIILGVQSQKNH